jgi:hypothetical protein
MSHTRDPWFRDPDRQGCLVRWSRSQGEGRGILLGFHTLGRPTLVERKQEIILDILDAETGRFLMLETWRVQPIE